MTVKQGDLWRAGWMYGFQPTHLSSSYAPTAVLALEKLLEVSSEQLMQAFERAGKFGDARMR